MKVEWRWDQVSACPSLTPDKLLPKLSPHTQKGQVADPRSSSVASGNANKHSEKQVEPRPWGAGGTLQNPFTYSVCLEIFIRC